MKKFVIQGDNDSFTDEQLFWSNEDGWSGFEGATVFELSYLNWGRLPLHSQFLGIAVLDDSGKVEKVYDVSGDGGGLCKLKIDNP